MKAFGDMNAVLFDSGFISIIFFVDVFFIIFFCFFLLMYMARLFPGYFLTTEDLHLGMSLAYGVVWRFQDLRNRLKRRDVITHLLGARGLLFQRGSFSPFSFGSHFSSFGSWW